MADFPEGTKYSWRDLGQAPDSVVERSEMERSIPKQRRITSDVREEMPMQLHFDSKAEAAAFETWFYDDIDAGQAFFDFVHPRLGTTVQARVVGGQLGALTFLQPTLEKCTRSIKLEYWRSTW